MESDTCSCCDLNLDDEQRVYYQHSMSSDWIKARYCWETISTMLKIRYYDYIDRIYKSKCKHELGEMLKSGPPRWYVDTRAMPVPDDAHITKFRRIINGIPLDVSALYDGAPELEEDRAQIWKDVETKIKERIRFIAIAEGRDPDSTDPVEPTGEDY